MNEDHDGYNGEPGTYILKGGERVAADPVTLDPLPIPQAEKPAPVEAQLPAPEPVAEKTKPAADPVKKTASDANLTE